MADAPSQPGSRDTDPATDLPPRTPRWVKVFGIIAITLVLAFLVLKLIGSDHGPGRHLGPGMHGGETPASTDHEMPDGMPCHQR